MTPHPIPSTRSAPPTCGRPRATAKREVGSWKSVVVNSRRLDPDEPDAEISLLGHSYGSLTSSLALQDLNAQGLHPVDNVVFDRLTRFWS